MKNIYRNRQYPDCWREFPPVRSDTGTIDTKEWEELEVGENFVPPQKSTAIVPDFDTFRKSLRKVIENILNAIAPINPTRKDDIRDAFRDRDLLSLIELWNLTIDEISKFDAALSFVNPETGKTRSQIFLESARDNGVPLGINDNRKIFSLLYRENLERSELQEILGELRDRGLTEINLTVSNDELAVELRKLSGS
ncbi:MAG: hypothetical protein J7647_32140 [Cyanobacteria bacterium SBLK]|nr:hypothetical protein [Cyanobacteria bacterium SBLK]